jgi:hypothetical protein
MSKFSRSVAKVLAWADDFEAGRVEDPARAAGILEPGERPALRRGPVTAVAVGVVRQGDTVTGVGVTGVGSTGTMLATDRRLLLFCEDGSVQSWDWHRDVDEVTAVAEGVGVEWSPSEARQAAGVRHVEGLVLPAYAHGDPPPAAKTRPDLFEWIKVQAAWRASRPGGLAAWRDELGRRSEP